jgi:tetratricopeptide (TPR) repeat protein
LGADKYKATIKRADELFKMKRYSEAKSMYEEALKQKPNDAAATNKLAEIEKLTIKK